MRRIASIAVACAVQVLFAADWCVLVCAKHPGGALAAETENAPARGPPTVFSLTLPNGAEHRVGNSAPMDTTPRMLEELVGEWRSEPTPKTHGIVPAVIFVFRPDRTYNEFIDFSGKGTNYTVQVWGTYDLWAVGIIGAQLELTPVGIQPDSQCSLWTGSCTTFPLERNIVSFVVDVPDHKLITSSVEFHKTSSEPGAIVAQPSSANRPAPPSTAMTTTAMRSSGPPDGYGDLKWGDAPPPQFGAASIEHMHFPSFFAGMAESDEYVVKDNARFFGQPVRSTHYLFEGGKLHLVEVNLAEGADVEQLGRDLTGTYGKPKESSAGEDDWQWPGKSSMCLSRVYRRLKIQAKGEVRCG